MSDKKRKRRTGSKNIPSPFHSRLSLLEAFTMMSRGEKVSSNYSAAIYDACLCRVLTSQVVIEPSSPMLLPGREVNVKAGEGGAAGQWPQC